MAEPRRIAVLGTGAMAMLFGARLARAGHRVTLHGRWREALGAIRDGGIRVEGEESSWRVPVGVRSLDEPAPEGRAATLALILVKSHQSRGVGRLLPNLLGSSGLALTLQNGLGNQQELEAAAGRAVAVGVTTAAARVLGPGAVREVSTGRTVVAAEQESVARLLGSGGFEAVVSRDLRAHAWLKLAVNCAINPVSALAGVPNGALLERPELRRQVVLAASEAAAVATALGVALPADPVAEALRVAKRTADNVSSMLQDTRRGASTEIEVMSGAVVHWGEKVGVPVPVNRGLLERVHELDAAVAAEAGA